MPATRERQERFIRETGNGVLAGRDAVLTLYHRHGLAMLTDEQIAEVASIRVADLRERNRRNRENRRRAAGSAYLNRPLRTLAQAIADRDAAR